MKLTFVFTFCLFCFEEAQALDTHFFVKQVAQVYLQQEEPQSSSTLERQQKSYGTALAWGFSPITGAGLYYTGHPVQGSLCLLTGIVGLPLLVTGLTTNIDRQNCDDCKMRDTLIGTGAMLYGAAYLWDALATLYYAREYKGTRQ